MDKQFSSISHEQDPVRIEALAKDLNSSDRVRRQEARHQLVQIGELAVPALIQALQSGGHHARWEAAKALRHIGDPTAALALVEAFQDQDFGVRWLAAEGLIALGREGLVALLQGLMQHSESVWLREGAHHVLRSLADTEWHQAMAPVLEALQDIAPTLTVPVAAHEALTLLRDPDDTPAVAQSPVTPAQEPTETGEAPTVGA